MSISCYKIHDSDIRVLQHERRSCSKSCNGYALIFLASMHYRDVCLLWHVFQIQPFYVDYIFANQGFSVHNGSMRMQPITDLSHMHHQCVWVFLNLQLYKLAREFKKMLRYTFNSCLIILLFSYMFFISLCKRIVNRTHCCQVHENIFC